MKKEVSSWPVEQYTKVAKTKNFACMIQNDILAGVTVLLRKLSFARQERLSVLPERLPETSRYMKLKFAF